MRIAALDTFSYDSKYPLRTLRNDIGYPVLLMTNRDIQHVTFGHDSDEGRTDYSDMGLLKDTNAFEVLGPGQEISFIMGYLGSDSEVGIWGIPGNIVFF